MGLYIGPYMIICEPVFQGISTPHPASPLAQTLEVLLFFARPVRGNPWSTLCTTSFQINPTKMREY